MQRVEKLRTRMKNEALDAYLVTSAENLRYLTGFTGTSGVALVTEEDAFFVTDFRYVEQAEAQVRGFTILQQRGHFLEEIADLLEQKKLYSLSFEDDFVTFSEYLLFEEVLDVELAPAGGFIERLRERKDATEIAIIEKACAIADAGFAYILEKIRPGITEIELANSLDFYMRSLGASGTSFETIVASGVRSALPHGVASAKTIEKGDMITLDFGCVYEGYVSDMTRTIALGEPDGQLKEIYQIVLAAQQKTVEKACAGSTGRELDAVARDFIQEAGYGEYFGHATGHGIGLAIHENPTISQRNDQLLETGNVITAEPGIYLAGLGGVRIEDDLVLLESGNRVLTQSPKELILL